MCCETSPYRKVLGRKHKGKRNTVLTDEGIARKGFPSFYMLYTIWLIIHQRLYIMKVSTTFNAASMSEVDIMLENVRRVLFETIVINKCEKTLVKEKGEFTTKDGKQMSGSLEVRVS